MSILELLQKLSNLFALSGTNPAPPKKKTFTTSFAKGSLLGRCSERSRVARFARVKTIHRPLQSLLARRGIFPTHFLAAVRNRRHSVTLRINLGMNVAAPPTRTGRRETHIGIPAGWEGATHGCAGWGSAGCSSSVWTFLRMGAQLTTS